MTIDEAIQILNLYDLGNVFRDIDGNPISSEKMSSACDMAVEALKALKQEPCEDCISRQAVEEMIKAEFPERGMWEIEGDTEKETVCEVCVDLMQKLSELPSVTPQPTRWIPVSERPPEYGESVLTWDGNFYFVEKRIPCIRDENGEPILSDWWVSDDYDESESEYYPNLRDGACIAWMPLPEPYKAESEE